MIQFKKMPRQTEGWKYGRTDGRTDRHYFIGPFRLLSGIQKDRLLSKLDMISRVSFLVQEDIKNESTQELVR